MALKIRISKVSVQSAGPAYGNKLFHVTVNVKGWPKEANPDTDSPVVDENVVLLNYRKTSGMTDREQALAWIKESKAEEKIAALEKAYMDSQSQQEFTGIETALKDLEGKING